VVVGVLVRRGNLAARERDVTLVDRIDVVVELQQTLREDLRGNNARTGKLTNGERYASLACTLARAALGSARRSASMPAMAQRVGKVARCRELACALSYKATRIRDVHPRSRARRGASGTILACSNGAPVDERMRSGTDVSLPDQGPNP
jgi:hypothetical protein